ncbi:MAG TPA: hypothetical protein VFN38_03510, partial [Gemmatimonadaceae bacterium]|nr:hypothetical protein [Gemmatimonadaceae bacterium]
MATAIAPTTVSSQSATGSTHFLDSTHPIWDREQETWVRNERVVRAGRLVWDYLARFRYEYGVGEQGYRDRQQAIVFLNFADIYLTEMCGQLMRHAPTPGNGLDFAELGEIGRTGRSPSPSNAELLYYNTDGVGVYGSEWDPYWTGVMKRAGVTGHRWCVAETPRRREGVRPSLRAERILKIRPYMVDHSPVAVRNWDDQDGDLSFAIIDMPYRGIKVEGDLYTATNGGARLLYTAEGFTDFGPAYKAGGWWLFSPERTILASSETTRAAARSGWESTDGRIPMFPMFYERYAGTKDEPSMSRSGVDELCQMAIAYMNMVSARNFDAWDAAASILLLLGVSDTQVHNAVAKQWKDGYKLISVPADPLTNVVPQVHDGSMGTVTSDVFKGATEEIIAAARQTAALEATSVPDSSGASKTAGFGQVKAPRLALMAS